MLTGISKLIFLLIVIGCAWSISASNVDPVVCCEKGCVRGKNFQGNNKEFEGFLGIPYAEPPVDALRLKVSKSKVAQSNESERIAHFSNSNFMH